MLKPSLSLNDHHSCRPDNVNAISEALRWECHAEEQVAANEMRTDKDPERRDTLAYSELLRRVELIEQRSIVDRDLSQEQQAQDHLDQLEMERELAVEQPEDLYSYCIQVLLFPDHATEALMTTLRLVLMVVFQWVLAYAFFSASWLLQWESGTNLLGGSVSYASFYNFNAPHATTVVGNVAKPTINLVGGGALQLRLTLHCTRRHDTLSLRQQCSSSAAAASCPVPPSLPR